MPASNYLVGKLLDHKNGVASYTAPATRYLQLDTTKYGADGAGGVALTGTGAARQAITWGTQSGRQSANTALITFSNSAPADWAGQTVKAWSEWDAPSGGNMLWYDDASTQLVIGTGSQVRVPIGQLTEQFPTT
jgi:hypothetical protein